MDDTWGKRELRGDIDRQVNQEGDSPDEPIVKMGYEGKTAATQAVAGEDLWEMHAAIGEITRYTAGHNAHDFAASEVLIATVEAMLGVMVAAFGRLQQAAPEIATRVDGTALLATTGATDAATWHFVQAQLPDLLARVTTELDAWHAG